MRVTSLVLVCALVAVAGSGCKVTPEEINTWKGTQKGPGKLRDVVKDKGAPPELRGLAYAALVEIGRGDEAATELGAVEPAARGTVAHGALEPLALLLGDSITANVPTTVKQRAAKDALFTLRADASARDRAQIDSVLLKWTTVDLATRASLGGQSTEKILRAIGPNATPALLPLVRPGPNLLTACRLIGELGDTAQKAQALPALLEIARGGAGGTRSITDDTLREIGYIGGPDATKFLLELAKSGPPDVRKRALYALAQGGLSAGDTQALDGALAIAADTKQANDVREAGFQVAEKIGPAAVGGLVKLLGDKDSIVRWRSVEAAFKAGGPGAIPRVLPALPEDRPVKSEDLDSYVVHDLTLLGKEAVPALLTAAKTGRPCGQIAALRALARVGAASDAGAVSTVAADPALKAASCKILQPSSTVGAEAQTAASTLTAKLGQKK